MAQMKPYHIHGHGQTIHEPKWDGTEAKFVQETTTPRCDGHALLVLGPEQAASLPVASNPWWSWHSTLLQHLVELRGNLQAVGHLPTEVGL